jgi:beta-barrel assembly-enhancing protease
VTARAILATCLLASALAAAAQGLPDLGDAASATLSETQERTIGNRIMREVRVDPAYLDDPEVADYIQGLGRRLAAGIEGARRELDFFVVQDDAVNAFALVGGHIGVHTGLLTLTQSESELAGVVSHEIAHITQRHQARTMHGQSRANWTSLAALAIAMLASRGGGSQAGQVTEAAIASAGAFQIQNQLDYTREHEREADRVGLVLLERAGFETRGMASFFERLARANRLNEFKGAPSYLRTHPLTTDRIADIQGRVQEAPVRQVPDSFEYRLVRAKLRAAAGSPAEAVRLFETILADRTVVRPREDVYGLALAQRRARNFDAAAKTLEPLREGASHPAFELLAGEMLAEQGKLDAAIASHAKSLQSWPHYRALAHAYLERLLQAGRAREVAADLETRLPRHADDPRLHEFQARAHAALGQPIAQHRAQAEALVLRGNLRAAVEQLEIAAKGKGGDFYEISSAESRLRELRALLEIEQAAEKALKIS